MILNIIVTVIAVVSWGFIIYEGIKLHKTSNKSLENLKLKAIEKGRMEGFNLAFFSVQDIILKAFANRGFKAESGYETLKEIMLESDIVIRNFYPEIALPSIEQALKEAEQDILSGKIFPFPSPGNNTLN